MVGNLNKKKVLVGHFPGTVKLREGSLTAVQDSAVSPYHHRVPGAQAASTTQHPSQPCPVIGLVICYMDWMLEHIPQ